MCRLIELVICEINVSSGINLENLWFVTWKDFPGHASNDCSRAHWTPSKDCYVIDLMLEEVHRGKKIDCNSKNQASLGMFMFKEIFLLPHDKDFRRVILEV